MHVTAVDSEPDPARVLVSTFPSESWAVGAFGVRGPDAPVGVRI